MGYEKRKNIAYANVSCGAFIHRDSKGGEKQQEFAYTGKLVSVRRIQDEFEGKPQDKIEITMYDDEADQTWICRATDETWYVAGFFSRILRADLSRHITLGVMASDQNEKVSFCWMKQGKDKITPDPDFPKPTKIEVGKKVTYDWKATTARINEIMAEIEVRLTPAVAAQAVDAAGDGLPF